MLPRCIALGFILILLKTTYAHNGGTVKISYTGSSQFLLPSSEGLVVCLARSGNDETRWTDCSCTKLDPPSAVQETEIYLPLQNNKVSTHIIAVAQQDQADADAIARTCETKFGKSSKVHSASLPLMFPGDDNMHAVRLVPGISIKLSLKCDENYFGPKCDVFCDSSRSGGSFTCHPQTGEVVCNNGWIGRGCDENVFIDRETASEFLKPRSKRDVGHEECSQRKCTKEELRSEFLLRGGELTEELWEIYNDENDCEPDPCHSNHTTFCEDLYQAHECHCKEGYKGVDCSDIDMCYFKPCLNGAACEDDGENVICDCLDGFDGQFCENEMNYCLDDPCGYYGDCTSVKNGFRCECDVGFTGERCEHAMNSCAESPCLNGGECLERGRSYLCLCELGYKGRNCEILADPCSSEPCLNGGECVSDGDDGFSCNCEVDFKGPLCETKLCVEGSCNGRGTCVVSFERHLSGAKQPYEQCMCDPGFTGKTCEAAVSPCEAAESPCPANATCFDLEEDYMCACPPGFEGENCERTCSLCEERNELKCEENPCHNGARCLSVSGKTTCICSPGFSGSKCEHKLDLCKENSCAFGECINVYGEEPGTICDCHEGYTGLHCDEDVNECEEAYGLCKNGATCDNLYGGFACLCDDGYTGRHCEHEINACFSDPCLNGGSCVNTGESFWCACKIGYIGQTCEERVDICNDEPSPCQNGGTCEILSLEDQEIKCTCLERFYGRHCERMIPSCMVKYEDYDGTHKLTERTDCGSYGTCVPVIGGFTCECKDGYTGKFCDERVQMIECTDVHCQCETGFINFKALNRKVDNSSKCHHSLYGRGTCGQEKCLNPPCHESGPLVCIYESSCFEKETSPKTVESPKSTKTCPIIQLHLTTSKLPEGTTLSDACEGVRHLTAFQPYVNDAVINCKGEAMDTDVIMLSAAVESKTSRYNARRVAIEMLAYLEEKVRSTVTDKNETNIILHSLENASFGDRFIKNVTDGEFDPQDGVEEATETSRKPGTVIIIVAALAAVIGVALITGIAVVVFMKRKTLTQPPTLQPLHSDNNNLPMDSAKWTKNGNLPSAYENPVVFGADSEKALEYDERKNHNTIIQQSNGEETTEATTGGVSTFLPPNMTNSGNSVPTR